MNSKIYKQICKVSLYLFPEYSFAKLNKRKKKIILKEKGIFGKRRSFKIEDLVFYYIPMQISLNKWQSEDWYNLFIKEWVEGELYKTDNYIPELIEFLKNEARKIEVLNTSSLICRYRKFVDGVGVVEEGKDKKSSLLETITEDILNTNKIFWGEGLLKFATVKTATWALVLYLNIKPLIVKVDFSKLLSIHPLITEMKSSLFYNNF
jgi:hypothetical protein